MGAREAITVALERLEVGDVNGAVVVLLEALDGPARPRTFVCECGSRVRVAGSSGRAPGQVPARVGGGSVSEERFELSVQTARELCATADPDGAAYLLGPYIRPRSRTIIGAHTGHGKTTFVGWMLSAFVNRGEFLDWTGAGGRALVLDLEQGARSAKRVLREVGLDQSDEVDYVLIPDGLELDRNQEHIAEVEKLFYDERDGSPLYDVVVVDAYYKAARIDPNDERQTVDLMRLLDRWRAEYGFALILTAHPRKPAVGQTVKLTMHDLAGSGALTRGAEIVLGLERVFDGGSRLHFWKDRDSDLPTGASWNLLYDAAGFRRDPKNEAPPRDLLAELEAFVRENPRLSTNKITERVKAGRGVVSQLLQESDRFEYEPGPNKARLWVARDAQTHLGHPDAPGFGGGGPVGGPSIEGHPQAIHDRGGLNGNEPRTPTLQDLDALAALFPDTVGHANPELDEAA